MYDVVIIGAGPAGLSCAKELSQTEKKVLIIEKNDFTTNKSCGGGLTQLVPQQYYPIEETILLPNNIRTLSRSRLHSFMAGYIENKQNIKILSNSLVKSIYMKEKKITYGSDKNDFEIEYKTLVGADGSHSLVRKKLCLKSAYTYGLYYEIREKIPFCIERNYNNSHVFYIWSFPHKELTNIGVYFDTEYISFKRAKAVLHTFLNNHSIDYSKLDIMGGSLSWRYYGIQFPNGVYLIGDAAGLVFRDSGEGISGAVLSGMDVGRKIIDPNYDMVNISQRVKSKEKTDLISF